MSRTYQVIFSIFQIPVIRATEEDMVNFTQFIERIEATYKLISYGAVKVSVTKHFVVGLESHFSSNYPRAGSRVYPKKQCLTDLHRSNHGYSRFRSGKLMAFKFVRSKSSNRYILYLLSIAQTQSSLCFPSPLKLW